MVQRSLSSRFPLTDASRDWLGRMTQKEPETSIPLKSNGRRERTLTRPEMPGSIRLAVEVLKASIAATAPAGKS